jgi:Domain of unknown function (DUF4917)
MAIKPITFEEALHSARGCKKRHLLLGNGFSIALRPDIFSYQSLYENADFSKAPHAKKIFDLLGTSDFETVIRALVNTAKLLKAYQGVTPSLFDSLNQDAAELKNVLVTAVGKHHPDRPFDIEKKQYAACRNFLASFDHIYTLNYDILLYWALMQDEVDKLDLRPDDGFRHPEDGDDAPYVVWLEAHSPTVHFLHGALHLFDDGDQIIKYTWSKIDVPLLEQIRGSLDHGRYPLFVSEGKSRDKLEKILHNAYLHKALRSFDSICDQLSAAIFIFGHSLAENDEHILRKISNGNVQQLFVSLHGDPDSVGNKGIVARAEAIVAKRKARARSKPLEVVFFQAESASVWG